MEFLIAQQKSNGIVLIVMLYKEAITNEKLYIKVRLKILQLLSHNLRPTDVEPSHYRLRLWV